MYEDDGRLTRVEIERLLNGIGWPKDEIAYLRTLPDDQRLTGAEAYGTLLMVNPEPKVSIDNPPALGAFRVMTYNVLAESYCIPTRYSYCSARNLSSEVRFRKIFDDIRTVQPDVICLQELESEPFEMFKTFLQTEYVGEYCKKPRGKPDGVAVFVRLSKYASRDSSWYGVVYRSYVDSK